MSIAIYLLIIVSLLLFPQVCAHAAKDALIIWSLQIVPSLFPYMVFSKLLAEQIKKTHFSPAAACMLLGTAGGSPSGAAMITSLSARLRRDVILPLCAFTGTISPMFFLGTVSQWTANPFWPKVLFLSQFLSAAITALGILVFSRKPATQPVACHPQANGSSPLVQSIDAILQIGGCIICFSVLAALLGLLPLSKGILPILHAILEVSGGVYAIIHSSFPELTKYLILAAVSGFGGLSILFQNLLFLKQIGVTSLNLLAVCLLRALFSVLFMLMLIAL